MLTVVITLAVLALAFDLSNGFHDSSNAIAALVATNAARPRSALLLAAVCHVAGPLLAGTAVADTVASVVNPPRGLVLPVIGAALTAALGWNIVTWRLGLPSSSSHALVGGLVGATFAADGVHSVLWGRWSGVYPHGVFGVLFGLAISPILGAFVATAVIFIARKALHRGGRRTAVLVRRSEWGTAALLAFSHGANDAQKTMGVLTLVLVASNHLSSFVVPLWVKLAAAAALTIGTALGGWRIVRTVGRGIYRLKPLDGLVSQASSAMVILAAAGVGAPVSTTHVVAASVVGVGASQRRRHVRWRMVAEMGLAWIVTLPLTALIAAALLLPWRAAT